MGKRFECELFICSAKYCWKIAFIIGNEIVCNRNGVSEDVVANVSLGVVMRYIRNNGSDGKESKNICI